MDFSECIDVSTGLVSVKAGIVFPFAGPEDMWVDMIRFIEDNGYCCVGCDITHIHYFKVEFRGGFSNVDLKLTCGYYWSRVDDPRKVMEVFCYMVDKLTEVQVDNNKDVDLSVEIPNLAPGGRAVRVIGLRNISTMDNKQWFIGCLKKWLVKIGYVG